MGFDEYNNNGTTLPTFLYFCEEQFAVHITRILSLFHTRRADLWIIGNRDDFDLVEAREH